MTDRLDRQQERMIENSRRRDVIFCELCDREIQEEQREKCIICKTEGCKGCLTRIDDGENQGYVCGKDCEVIARAPEVQAAKRAAHTGSHKDLKAYLKAREASA